MPANQKSGRSSRSANQWVTLGRLSVHSQKLVTGTRQRCSGFSHGRQKLLFRLRTLVTGREPLGGGGNPQRSMASSRTPSSAVRTTGAMVSG